MRFIVSRSVEMVSTEHRVVYLAPVMLTSK